MSEEKGACVSIVTMISSSVSRQPVKCGQTIRLLHLQTKKNLHSHHFQSPLSHNLEVSAFGEDGDGDEGRHGNKLQKSDLRCPIQYSLIYNHFQIYDNFAFL